MSAPPRKRGRRRTPCPRCGLTTCDHCRCEGCVECDHERLACNRARYPKRTMCTSCIKKQEKLRRSRKRGQPAPPVALVTRDKGGNNEGHAQLESLSALFARAATLHHLDPGDALRQAAGANVAGFGYAMSSLSGLVASLGPDFAPLARSLPPPPAMGGDPGFLADYDTCASHVAWSTGLGGPELWGTAPMVEDGKMFTSAAALASPRGAHFVASVRGRVIHVSFSLACYDAVRPYAEAASGHGQSPGNVWADEALGMGGPMPALVSALVALCRGESEGAEDLSQLFGRSEGEESPASAAYSGRVAFGAGPPSPASGSPTHMDTPTARRRAFLSDPYRVAKRLQRIAGRREAPGASPLPGASIRMTVYPRIHAGSPPLPTRMSVAPLRRRGEAGRRGGEDALLHVSFLPHALAPLFHPVGQGADAMPASSPSAEPVGGSLPVPQSPEEAVARLRAVWRGAPAVATSLPHVLSPLLTVYRAVPASSASRGVTVLATPPRPGPGAGRSCPLLVCSEAARSGGCEGADAEPTQDCSAAPQRTPRTSDAAAASGAPGDGVKPTPKLSGAADAYAVAGALTGTPLGSVREECARLRAVYSALLHVPRKWLCAAPGSATGPDVVWVAAREGEAAAHAARKMLWWLVGTQIVGQCTMARRCEPTRGALHPRPREAPWEGAQAAPPRAPSPEDDFGLGSPFASMGAAASEPWPTDELPLSPELDSMLASSAGFDVVDGERPLEDLLDTPADEL